MKHVLNLPLSVTWVSIVLGFLHIYFPFLYDLFNTVYELDHLLTFSLNDLNLWIFYYFIFPYRSHLIYLLGFFNFLGVFIIDHNTSLNTLNPDIFIYSKLSCYLFLLLVIFQITVSANSLRIGVSCTFLNLGLSWESYMHSGWCRSPTQHFLLYFHE